jgi:FtsZ-binding cell division protein ZapB
LSIGASSSIIANDETPNRSNSLINNRLSLPNVDHIQQLKREVDKLKRELNLTQESHRQKMEQLVKEEQDIRNENLRLQRKLQLEVCFFILK